ncbi:SGNH/GDSL hydrolase family protein [Wenyingzhuangia sp. 1_MG-2023]|nr:SGNH/GDSL hydrolase family protein [Wenyingzhuangia sp. 1_MG-2023]
MSIALLFIFFSCNPSDGLDGNDGKDANFIGLEVVEDVDGCSTLTFYYDINKNHIRDVESESVIKSFDLCDGENGIDGEDASFISLEVVESVDGCSTLTFYYDINKNEIRDVESESVIKSFDLCDGENGIDGEDASFISLEVVENVDGCSTLTFYYDIDKNDVRDIESESVIKSFDLCDGENVYVEKNGKTISQNNLIDGTSIAVTDFPYHLKKGLSMSIQAKFETFTGSISYGKGFDEYRGDWLEIDETNIYWKHKESGNAMSYSTVPHGLKINTFIKSTLFLDDSSGAYVILQTLGGYFKTTFNWGYEANYSPFIRTEGQDLIDVKISASSKEFQHSVWAFGDSYFGVGSSRWPGVMKEFGFFNFLFDGIAGQNSGNAYSDLVRCLEYGTPKYIIWCLGMNDQDNNFETYLNRVKLLCEQKDIELILSTVPTVPTRNKENISEIVRNSGYRYIDFYDAMGTSSTGVWYEGYLSDDGVHPTSLGAQALATQVLIDFPELMQYGLVSTN